MGITASKYCFVPEEPENSKAMEKLRATAIQAPKNVIINDNYIENWTNNTQDLMWDVNFETKGIFSVALGISATDHANVEIEVEINEATIKFDLTPDMNFEKCTKLTIGSLLVKNPGFSIIRLRAKGEAKDSGGHLYFIELCGPAIRNLRNHSWSNYSTMSASDVYLVWHTKSTNMNMFYNEITILDHNTDALFVVCGFYRGYIGLQEGNIYFAIESPGLDPNLPEDKIPQRYKVKTMKQMYGTRIEYHSGQTRASCTFYHQWKTNETYRFVLTSKLSNVENATLYSAFFYRNDTQDWVLLATFKVTMLPRLFSDLYSSIESCESYHGFYNYEAHFGPAMIHVRGKGWAHLVKAQFQQREDDNLPTDVDAGVTKENKIYLSTGQPAKKSIPLYNSVTCQQANLPECLVNFDPDAISSADEFK